MHLRTILVPVLGLAVMVLSGCSSGPSESDIENALKSSVNNEPDHYSADEKANIATLKVKKVDCKSDDVRGFICKIEQKTEKSMADGKNVRIQTVRMIKGSAGWTVEPL